MKENGRSPAKTLRNILLVALIALIPCSLLLDFTSSFSNDWINNFWYIDYYAEYLRRHLSLPLYLNCDGVMGAAQPAFYGYLFYPAMGFLSWLLPVGLLVRFSVMALLLAQLLMVYSSVRKFALSRALSLAAGCLVVWAVYPLTNLYTRSALPEFFAAGFLTCAVCAWFQFCLASDAATKKWLAHVIGLFLCLSAGIHPITAVYGTGFLACLMVSSLALIGDWRSSRFFIIPALLAAVVLSGWIYISARYSGSLYISNQGLNFTYYPGIDTLASRLYFLPRDIRMDDGSVYQVSTPYLDTTINLSLMALLLALGWRARERRSRLVCAGVMGVAFFLLLLSVHQPLMAALPHFFSIIQFGYRLVTYVNLTFFAGLCLVWLAERRPVVPPRLVVVVCLMVSFSAMVVKLVHGGVTMNLITNSKFSEQHLTQMPITVYSQPDYSVPELYQFVAAELGEMPKAFLKPLEGEHFGEWEPRTFKVIKGGWVLTNIMPFPWTEIWLDRKPVSTTDLGVTKNGFVAVRSPAGEHTLDMVAKADSIWLGLRTIGWGTLLVWVLGLVVQASRVYAKR